MNTQDSPLSESAILGLKKLMGICANHISTFICVANFYVMLFTLKYVKMYIFFVLTQWEQIPRKINYFESQKTQKVTFL